ncbi:MAG: hypothetical protein WCE87_00890 [Candidatus Udaeobacter sp.]
MAEPNEPKKETTRISVAPEAADTNTKSRDTVRLPIPESPVRILVEPRPVSTPSVQEVVSPQFFQRPQPPPVPLNASVMPAPDLPPSGPIKETVRIPLRAVQMKKTQPLIAIPENVPQNPSIVVAPLEKNSMPLLWLLLGVSAMILIIQIWTYLS